MSPGFCKNAFPMNITEIMNELVVENDPAKVAAFSKVNEDGGWMSNMSGHSLNEAGKEYPTAEHYFQCMRLKPEFRQEVRRIKSPMGCKMRVRRIKKQNPDCFLIPTRGEEDVELMRKVLRLKIQCNAGLIKSLLRTEDRFLIEDVSNRHGESAEFWGMRLVDGNWTGKGVLGKLWMELREELRKAGATL